MMAQPDTNTNQMPDCQYVPLEEGTLSCVQKISSDGSSNSWVLRQKRMKNKPETRYIANVWYFLPNNSKLPSFSKELNDPLITKHQDEGYGYPLSHCLHGKPLSVVMPVDYTQDQFDSKVYQLFPKLYKKQFAIYKITEQNQLERLSPNHSKAIYCLEDGNTYMGAVVVKALDEENPKSLQEDPAVETEANCGKFPSCSLGVPSVQEVTQEDIKSAFVPLLDQLCNKIFPGADSIHVRGTLHFQVDNTRNLLLMVDEKMPAPQLASEESEHKMVFNSRREVDSSLDDEQEKYRVSDMEKPQFEGSDSFGVDETRHLVQVGHNSRQHTTHRWKVSGTSKTVTKQCTMTADNDIVIKNEPVDGFSEDSAPMESEAGASARDTDGVVARKNQMELEISEGLFSDFDPKQPISNQVCLYAPVVDTAIPTTNVKTETAEIVVGPSSEVSESPSMTCDPTLVPALTSDPCPHSNVTDDGELLDSPFVPVYAEDYMTDRNTHNLAQVDDTGSSSNQSTADSSYYTPVSSAVEKVASKQKWFCNKCHKKFTRKDNLKVHMKLHEDPYVCEFCSEGFSQKRYLNDHIRFKHDKMHIQCGICDKQYSSFTGLRTHMMEHRGQYKHLCPICGECFIKKTEFEAHVGKHRGVKPYKCHCGQSYAHSSSLSSHKLVCGIPGKTFQCEICAKTFSHPRYKREHLKMHINQD